jgi:hypothetical protein
MSNGEDVFQEVMESEKKGQENGSLSSFLAYNPGRQWKSVKERRREEQDILSQEDITR